MTRQLMGRSSRSGRSAQSGGLVHLPFMATEEIDPPIEILEEPDEDSCIAAAPLTTLVIRSAKRRKTVGAKLVGTVVEVTVPSWMSKADVAKWVEEMRARFARARSTTVSLC